MPLILSIFLERVADTNGSVTQVLSVHSLYSTVTSFKVSEVDKREPFRVTSLGISHNLGIMGLQVSKHNPLDLLYVLSINQ